MHLSASVMLHKLVNSSALQCLPVSEGNIVRRQRGRQRWKKNSSSNEESEDDLSVDPDRIYEIRLPVNEPQTEHSKAWALWGKKSEGGCCNGAGIYSVKALMHCIASHITFPLMRKKRSSRPACLNDYCPAALNSVVMKVRWATGQGFSLLLITQYAGTHYSPN